MFNNLKGASGKFQFKVITFALQKSLLRGDIDISLEMAKEFRDNLKMLQRILVKFCCDNCPNVYLINDIACAKLNLLDLINFVPTICIHIKSNESILGFRVICETEYNNEQLSEHDDLLTTLNKCRTILCQNDNDNSIIIDYFQKLLPSIKLKIINSLVSHSLSIIFMLCSWKCINYITKHDYERLFLIDYFKNKYDAYEYDSNEIFNTVTTFLRTFNITDLPEYTRNEFNNISGNELYTHDYVLYPRMPITDIEKRGLELILSSERSYESFIKPVLECKQLNDITLIQTVLSKKHHNPKVYFCDIGNSNKFKYVIKGPFTNKSNIAAYLLSDYIKRKINLKTLNYTLVEYNNEYYIRSNNIIYIDPSKTKFRKSLNDSGVIYSGSLYQYDHKLVDILTNKQFIELFKILIYRKAIGSGNNWLSNIIFYNGEIITVSDPVLCKNTEYIFRYSINDESLLRKYIHSLKRNFKKIKQFIGHFMNIVITDNVLGINEKMFISSQLLKLNDINRWKFNDF